MAGGEDMRRGDTDQLLKLVQWAEDHEKHESEWREIHDQRLEEMHLIAKANAEAISLTVDRLEKLGEDTELSIQIARDVQGAARIGVGVQNFMIWLMKWGALGSAAAASIHYIATHLKGH